MVFSIDFNLIFIFLERFILEPVRNDRPSLPRIMKFIL